MHARAWLGDAGQGLLELLVPHVCATCGVAGVRSDGDLCGDCGRKLSAVVSGAYCATCGDDHQAHLLVDGRCTACRLGKVTPRFDGAIRVGRYDSVLRVLVLRFKREFILDGLLGRLLATAVQGRLDPRTVDYWVPVPAHWRRRFILGYQPTALLARAVVRTCGGRLETALRMTRYVRPFHLSGPMSAKRRAEAIRGAFSVVAEDRVAGRTVCLIDDVMTTGATLGEAARVLRKAGAARVLAAVVARASSACEDVEGAGQWRG